MVRRERELRQLAEREGLEVLDVTLGGRTHYRINVRATDGRTKTFSASLTPSDRNGVLAERAGFRKFVRGIY